MDSTPPTVWSTYAAKGLQHIRSDSGGEGFALAGASQILPRPSSGGDGFALVGASQILRPERSQLSCEAPPQNCHVDFQPNINQYFVFGFARRHNHHGSTPPSRGRLRAPTIPAGPRISADLHSATPQRA